MFSCKEKFLQHLIFLRGNLECASITLIFDVNQRKRLCDVFKTILLNGLIDEKITCMCGTNHFDEFGKTDVLEYL